MPIFGQYQGGDAFNVSQNMDAVLQQQQATAQAMINVGPAIQKTREEMDVLRGTASSILSQYSTDESGKPSDSAPKYIHDIYKSINKEGGLNYLSKSQLVAALEGYKTGSMVEEQALNVRAKQQQYAAGQLALNKAQAEWDEYQRVLLAHKLAMETAGNGTNSASNIIDAVAKYAPEAASVATSLMPSPIGTIAGVAKLASGNGVSVTNVVPSATQGMTAPATAPTTAQPQSKTLEYRVPASRQQEMLDLEKEKLKAQLEAKKIELGEVGKKTRSLLDYVPYGPLTTSYGLSPANPISNAAGMVKGTIYNESAAEKGKRLEAEQARIVDEESAKSRITAEIAEITSKLQKLSPDAPTKPEPSKPVGATPILTPPPTVQSELDKAKTNLSAIKSSAPMKPEDALKDGNIGKIHAEFVKQTGRALYTGSPLWSRKDIIRDNRFDAISSVLTNQYLKDTGVDVVKLDSEGQLTQETKDDFYEWADINSQEGKLETLKAFAKSNYDSWKYKSDNAEAQVKLLTNASKREQEYAKTSSTPSRASALFSPAAPAAPAAPTAALTPVPASIAPSGSTSAPVATQRQLQPSPILPVESRPELKSDDEKITEEYGQLTSRLRSMGGVPLNWSESTYRQMRGYPPKIRIVSSNGVKLVGIGDKWEVMQEKGMSITDQIALEKQAILKNAMRVDGMSSDKWAFRGDIRTTEANEAGKVKESVLSVTRAIDAIDRLIELGKTDLWDSITPTEKSGIIEAVTNSVQAAGRTEIAGSGAFSEQDAKKLESIVPSLASISGAVFREQSLAKLNEYRTRMSEKVKGIGIAWGFQVAESAASGLTQQQEALIRLRYNEYRKQGADHEQAKQAAKADVLNK